MGVVGRKYSVVVQYREPTYEARHGAPEKPYRYSVEVVAIDDEHAREKAVEAFHAERAKSSVSWVIQIVRVLVSEL